MKSEKAFPRLLIVSPEPLNQERGAGITMTNLFKGWPAESLSVLFWSKLTPDTSLYKKQFRIQKIRIQKFRGERANSNSDGNIPLERSQERLKEKTGQAMKLLKSIVKTIEKPLGFFQYLSKFCVSDEIKNFICSFNPQVIYFTLNGSQSIEALRALSIIENIPIVVHIYDDWIKGQSHKKSISSFIRHMKDSHQFKQILSLSKKRIAIGSAMADEYERRYGQKFEVFQNVPDRNTWRQFEKFDYRKNQDSFTFVFIGNIYNGGNLQSILDFSRIIEGIQYSPKPIFHIHTTEDAVLLYKGMFDSYGKTELFVVPNDINRIGQLYIKADAMLLAINEDKKGKQWLGLSMPTKLPAALIVGVPLIVVAPKESALHAFIQNNDFGYAVDKQRKKHERHQEIVSFIANDELREKRAHIGKRYAQEYLNDSDIREKFQETIRSAVWHKDENS